MYIQAELVAKWKTVKISFPGVNHKIQYSKSVSEMANLWLVVYKQYILHIHTSPNFTSTL